MTKIARALATAGLALALAVGVAGAAPAKKKPPPPPTIGSVLRVANATGAPYTVELVHVFNPAAPKTATYGAASAGTRYVAAELTLRDAGKRRVSDDANDDASLIGSNHQTYTATFGTVKECTNFAGGVFHLAPGIAAIGCVVFAVPDAVGVSRIEWSGTGGFGTSFVSWVVPAPK